jgi:methyl-accepting chemotaxis protein
MNVMAKVAEAGHDPLARVLRITEETFVAAGDSLSRGVDILRGTEGIFAKLDHSLGDETGVELGRLIALTYGNLGAIKDEFDGFMRHSDALRTSVRRVRLEVGELDRVVRTISNVSINARIQGNGLVPPRPQVNSFIERLASMASEAEGILQEVKEAMVGIGHDTDTMEKALQDLQQELVQQVLPALRRFATIAQQVQNGRAEMTRMSGELAARMKSIFGEVSKLITALQSGDSTRQRLERVGEVTGACHGAAPGLEALLVELARDLAVAARDEADSEIAISISALDAVRLRAEQAMQAARHFYFSQIGGSGSEQAGASDTETLTDSLERARRHLVSMRGRAETVRGRLDLILKHEATIRQIAQQVRLSGLNAVLICAKLGEEGRSLRELAQWLRTLTDESDAIVLRLQGNLAETRTCTRMAGQEGVDRLETALSGFISDAEALNGTMGGISAVVGEAARGFDAAGRELPMRLGQAAQRLGDFRRALGDVSALISTLTFRRMVLGEPDLPLVEDSPEADLIARLRSRCTMQAEREIFDRATGAPVAAAMPTPMASAAAPDEAAADDLDDIFF